MCSKLLLKEISSRITDSAKEVLGDKLHDVILYGSYARGNYNEDSDIDIMVLADVADEDVWQIEKPIDSIASEMELEYDIMISVMIKNKKLFEERSTFLPFYQNVIKDGIKLYG